MRGLVRNLSDFLQAREQHFPSLESLHHHIKETVSLEILQTLKVLTVPRKKKIYQPGDDSDEIYYLLEGRVTLFTNSSSGKKKKSQADPALTMRSISLTDTYFGQHEVAQEKRRIHTVVVDTVTADLLIIPSKYYSHMKHLKKEQSNVFQGLQLSLTYELIPKLMRVQKFVKGQEYNHREYPIGVIINGELEVRRQIDLLKEDVKGRFYEFKKSFSLLTFSTNHSLLWNCICTSAFAEVAVMDMANYRQLCQFDRQLRSNVEQTIQTFELAAKERSAQIRKTFDYRDVEQSLGLSVHFKTEPAEQQRQLRHKPTQRDRFLKLRRDIIERVQEQRIPNVMTNVLFKMPMSRHKISEVRRKIQQLEVRNDQCPEYDFLNKEFNRLFTPSFNSKFEMKMLQNTRSVGKTAGFAFFKERQQGCRKRRSLVLIS